MNPKIDKLAREIEKTRARIIDDQERLKIMEQQKIDMENNEVISLLRSANVNPGDVAEFILSYKGVAEGSGSASNNTQTPAMAAVLPSVSGGQPANRRNAENFSERSNEEEIDD